MFILLMFFLFKYIDDLIGKGFEWYTIAEVMVYASATNVAMALPLAVLLSSIMTFGNLGENYELVAIKSAGVSLQKAMRPLFILIIGLSLSSFLFMDYMLPKANAKFYSLIFDIRNKKK
jgi:lipopolysaccharide export system permease protein